MDEQYLKRMEKLIPDEMDQYINLLDSPLYQGLRLNPLKTSTETLEKNLPFLKEKSPFAPDSWYVEGHYGNHAGHLTGQFYLQEPSASSAVEILDLKDGMNVLDLCAAPGSKSTQIAAKIPNGFLVCNELDSKRAQALLSNMERMGVENFLCTNMDGRDLCRQMPEFFDRILVDAPCSGEGMMRKHDAASEKWSLENVLACSARQKEILESSVSALKPGGQLVYSTCTYAPEENEENVAWILKQFPELKQLEISVPFGRKGIPVKGMDENKVCRIFPMDGGEGHFIARFEKTDQEFKNRKSNVKSLTSERADPLVIQFLNEQIGHSFTDFHTEKINDTIKVYAMNHPFLRLKKGKILRQGIYLGDLIKKRFEPAHAFFLSQTNAKDSKRKVDLNLDEMDHFMHGEQLNLTSESKANSLSSGYVSVCSDGIPFGYGKKDPSRITNKIPKGLRLPSGSHVMKPEDRTDH
ncbi:RsmB/NOP family class I SAM-dependent RNA methyltransferase [Ileibacterium valens]|uniref:RsmB/NOP family class I SAM-dependent RNA methyltransferase n=1 Tax=Ileibacterium valens TaxID=1862668 RepID=UPI00272A328A|nr:RsmB/NOP family class I SAM-dependent RNA methyltransferase [Ileibacterium valens]